MEQGIRRKRAIRDVANLQAEPAAKKSSTPPIHDTPVRRDLLEQCYPRVQTLRQYLLAKLPGSSRLRRKKIAAIGQSDRRELETRLAHLLDTTLVCASKQEDAGQDEIKETRWKQWLSFSQKGDESYVTLSGSPKGPLFSQSEIIDFVIWLLFSREKAGPWPKHLLCDGFRKGAADGEQGATSIPGIFCRFPNCHVKMLKETPWPQVLALLGQSGERVMIDLLLDCSVFVAVQVGFRNYYQLSGPPLSEVDLSRSISGRQQNVSSTCRKPSDITLVRSRIFYAKPSLNARGLVQAGLKHIHVLNRCPYIQIADQPQGEGPNDQVKETKQKNDKNTIMVMMYIFPRQFKLHNVFTSEVDRTQTAQKFQDYTLREIESQKQSQDAHLPKIPKRLRGATKHLVQRLQVRHGRCSYIELLRHYCPCSLDPRRGSSTPVHQESAGLATGSLTAPVRATQRHSRSHVRGTSRKTQSQRQLHFDSVVELACPKAHVSAFCQAALSKIIPGPFWGEGDTMVHNKKLVLRKLDHFVKLRRFETMSLHEIAQGFKIVDIPWLQPPHLHGQRTSQTDLDKRCEIFHEFLYYVFDSLLLPLIRSNFYVTESNTHRYQIFYFRHDVWKRVAEPAMAALKDTMFEEVKFADASGILQSRNFGFSHVRLLPKGQQLRPIMNLRRRTWTKGSTKVLGPSINAVLSPVHTVLKLEKTLDPSKLGSTMFSVNDIYTKLKSFKAELGPDHSQLYLAKLDVHAAFDTIPQDAVVRLMASVPGQSRYTITRHAEVKPGERSIAAANKPATKPVRKWHATAFGHDESNMFPDHLKSGLGDKKKNTVFINSAARKTHSAGSLLNLLAQHVTQNLVKVGKKYYRQKTGIPQGSVLSSFLCNYFYADLEIHQLGFLNGPDCLLLRLIDDFLLVTLDKSKAVRFVETMHRGLPEYGVHVSPKKTLVNFDMEIPEGKVNRVAKEEAFPYCGTLIDCRTLEISKDREKSKNIHVSNSLTVDFGRSPGQNFERKVLGAFKIQSHLMFFDTEHNSTRTVLATLRGAFAETATKMWAYIRCMPLSKRPRSSLVIRTIIKVIDVAFMLLTSKSRKMRYEEYSCDLRKARVSLNACEAFKEVLGRKQSGYGEVIAWLGKETARLECQK